MAGPCPLLLVPARVAGFLRIALERGDTRSIAMACACAQLLNECAQDLDADTVERIELLAALAEQIRASGGQDEAQRKLLDHLAAEAPSG